MLMFINASVYINHLFLAKSYTLFQRSHFSLRSKKDIAITSLFVTKVCQTCCREEPSQSQGVFSYIIVCVPKIRFLISISLMPTQVTGHLGSRKIFVSLTFSQTVLIKHGHQFSGTASQQIPFWRQTHKSAELESQCWPVTAG